MKRDNTMNLKNQPTDRERWEDSFREQIKWQAYNTAPVEAVIRLVAYYLRDRYRPEELSRLHFLELGCGAAPNLLWLAQRGIRVSGVDVSPTALQLARATLDRAGYSERIGSLVEASAAAVPFPDQSFDGLIEACVFQHLARPDRERAFAEVRRLLKPDGVFVGYLLGDAHSVYQAHKAEELADDPGTVVLSAGGSKFHLTNIGLSHFFRREEFSKLLPGFSLIEPCMAAYDLPRPEAEKRGYETYRQSMWAVYAVK